jgi:hypothetical protein
MPLKRITDDGAPKARKPRDPKERPAGTINTAWAADVERRQTETRGRAEREKKLAAKRAAAAADEQASFDKCWADRLQASFDKCWADTRAHNTGRDSKYDARWKEMLANQSAQIALLKTTSAAKKRNTDLAFLIGGNDAAMDEETRAWYDAHCQAIFRPPSTASSSPSTMSTPAADDTSPPEAQEGTADEPVVV